MYRARHAQRTGGTKFGKLVAMMGLTGALVLSLTVPAALAGPKSNSQGGSKGYVTDFSDGTCLPLEQNQIEQTDTIYVDLKIPASYTDDLVFTIYENGTSGQSTIVYGPTTLTPIDCPGIDGNLWYVTLTVDDTPITGATLGAGSFTLVVDYPDGTNFSADSFIVLP